MRYHPSAGAPASVTAFGDISSLCAIGSASAAVTVRKALAKHRSRDTFFSAGAVVSDVSKRAVIFMAMLPGSPYSF